MSANVAITDTFDQWRTKSNEWLSMTSSAGSDNFIKLNNTTNSTSNTTGSIVSAGGLGIGASATIGGNLTVFGDADVDGTLNVDAVDIDGAMQLDSTLTVGVDDTGYDVKFFGATSGSYMLWDESEDDLVLAGVSNLSIDNTTDSSSTTTGSFHTDGGAGIAKKLFVGTDLDVNGTSNLDAVDIDGAVQIDATVTVGVDDTGHDVKFFGATASAFMLWDESEDDLVLSGTAQLSIDTTTDASSTTTGSFHTDGGVGIAKKLYVGTDLDVDGTSNLDAVDIDGATQIDGTVTVGVDDTGHDVKLFGATSGAYLLWDESADKLLTAGGAVIDIVKDKLLIGGTAVTTTAAELNLLDNVSGLVQADFTKLAAVDSSDSELNLVDGSSAGTIVNSKAVIYGSSGEVNATTLQIGGTAITSTAAEINLIDGSSAGTAVASKAAIYSGTSGLVIGNEATIGSTGDTDAVRIGAGGSVGFSNNTVLYGASNSTVAVASTQTFSGTVGTSATAVVFTFKGADGTSGTIVTGATNYQGGEIVLTLKKGSDVETKKLMVHHTGAPDSPGSNIFITEFATLGTEIGETIAVSMGDADGTGLTSNSDKHVHLKLTNPSGTDAMTYAGVAHLVEIPGDS